MEESRFPARDGAELYYRIDGVGRPLILFSGLMGSGSPGLDPWAELFTGHGHSVIRPDFRGHGRSAKPHGAAYPPDVLVDDALELIAHLGLADGDYDLGGYSLGARVVLRMLVRGSRPGRAIAVAQGLEKVTGPQGDASRRILEKLAGPGAVEPGSQEEQFGRWAEAQGADVTALLLVLDSLVPTSETELRGIDVPTLIAIGDGDERSDADELAALLPNGVFLRVPGDHGTAFGSPELAAAMIEFLDGAAVSPGSG